MERKNLKLCLSILSIIFLSFFNTACSSDGGSSGGNASIESTNGFTSDGSPLTVNRMVENPSSSSLSTATDYYGRFVAEDDSGNLFVGTAHFTLNREDDNTAYFSDFYLDYFARVTGYNSSTTIQGSSSDLGVPVGYNSNTNSVTIANSSQRIMSFSVDFTDNSNINDVNAATMVFSTDFTTMVGGASDFFFVAQKASAHSTASIDDLDGAWGLVNFTAASGEMTIDSFAQVVATGTGGNDLQAFTGQNESGGAPYGGEYDIVDANAGAFAFGFDLEYQAGDTPTASGDIHGIFLQSPDKNVLFGVNSLESIIFAATR